MNNKLLAYNKDARDKLCAGADKLAKAVVSTLGPRSRNVAIDMPFPAPRIIHDGVTVARAIKLKDKFENMGVALLREAATKTNGLAGDGTTTATLLANTLLQQGKNLVEPANTGVLINGTQPLVNPMDLRAEIAKYADIIVGHLEKIAMSTKTESEKIRVATVSSGSVEMGKLVGEAVHKSGENGLVMVEETSDFECSVEYQQGMEFDNGYLSPYFVTDPARMVVNYTGGGHYVLLTDQIISNGESLANIVTAINKQHGNKSGLIIVAGDVVGPALHALIATKHKLGFPVVAVIAPEYAERRKEMLEDMAILTGGTVITADQGMRIEDVTIGQLGRVRDVLVSDAHTTLAPENPDAEEIQERCEAIKRQIELQDNPIRRDKLQNRLAKLSQSVAIIRVGGSSELEIDDNKERIEDAVNATKAAATEGVVAGGGVALHYIASILTKIGSDEVYELVKEVLRSPFKTLIENNTNQTYESVLKLLELFPETEKKPEAIGYDVVTGRVMDLRVHGIIDPVKVTKLAVRHAFSIAAQMLTTECLIAEEEDESIQKMQIMNAK